MTPDINRSLDDKYQIIREIKKGGFGIVYYGVDKKLSKPVAIKEIAPSLLDDPKYLDMFQEEALNIAKLSHNNIVHIYELKKTSDRHLFIIMEYIDGIDMEKVIRHASKIGKPIPHHLAVYVISEICMALEYAHQRRDAFTNRPLNLVHQDISPSNIMISRYGVVKLIDFGIATVRRHRKEKKDSKLRGKIPYMAPEQLIMGNHADHRSDIFSLGLVLYECVSGERLFSTQEEVIGAGKNPKWFKKALKGKRIPTPLVKILLKSLEIDLSKRYQSANHMYIDLLQYLISCNETGELMDDLAAFLSDQFPPATPGTTPTGYQYGPARPQTDSNFHTPGPRQTSQNWTPAPAYQAHSKPVAPRAVPRPPQDERLDQHQKFPTNFATMEFEQDGEEDLKTVIDVLRVSARNNKKRIAGAFIALLLTFATLGAFDTANGWTSAGVWMYDFLFPPVIEIATVPKNALVQIDGKEIAGRAPVSIDEISPGVHKLELALDGYKPIVKSLFVPRDGDVRIQGETSAANQRTYLFRFNTEVEINSEPTGAGVLVNGIRLNQKTPCKIAWEIGKPLNIELQQNGFEKLSNYSLDTESGFDNVDDRRLWKLNVYNDTYVSYAVTGIFRKRVHVESVPTGAEIFDKAKNQLIGISGSSGGILLPVGRHELEFRKKNFISRTRTLQVDEASDGRLQVVLSRMVRLSARDGTANNLGDIAATLISVRNTRGELVRNRRQTPIDLALPATQLTAVFSKPGYERRQIAIKASERTVVVELQPLRTTFEVAVLDALTEQPIIGAELFYLSANGSGTQETALGRTDITGVRTGSLPPGSYTFTARWPGYNALTRQVQVRAGQPLNLIFEIFPSN